MTSKMIWAIIILGYIWVVPTMIERIVYFVIGFLPSKHPLTPLGAKLEVKKIL